MRILSLLQDVLLFFILQYGGDITRRRKLLARQKEGKERLKMVANIGLPRDTFIKLLKK